MSFVSATGSYGSCRGCGRELTVVRTMHEGWHDACAARSGLAEPLSAPGEVASRFGAGRQGRVRRRELERRRAQQRCHACHNPIEAQPTRRLGYHDKCANRMDAEAAQIEAKRWPSRSKHFPRTEVGRPHLLVELGDQCYFCGDDLTAFTITREHLTPTSRGGANDELNVVAACRRCNGAKGDMTEDEFRTWLERVTGHYLS